MASKESINQYFDKIPGSNKYHCRLCKGRGMTDTVKHAMGKLHRSKVAAAQKAQEQKNIQVAGLTADDRRMVGDNVGWNQLEEEIHMPDAGPVMEIDEDNEFDMEAWLKNLRDQAASPIKNESEEEDVRPFNWQHFLQHPDDEDQDSINSEDKDDKVEDIPLALENNDDTEANKWYPFSKMEVMNSIHLDWSAFDKNTKQPTMNHFLP
ncbi:uncharacterized protein MELLADRAFT_69060 [Melampsora larici-populina 98AG31]|uniref:Uncharacterized protein n=1 Tax=Melampsora larici-populina (strain 98AG31 / pathotype 3-4-7) TaxID=747676 RepID=F4S993_MELLP|nr:uncharacterized protein MELLADRAFT_69060 [Melampsora larici-populina 98AG31]EGF98779.1 hypothetical protein MELLADRAFT_69060 [Melampsora larici-populina 98AG31]